MGIELKGTEIKSLKNHSASLDDAYVIIKGMEAYVIGMNIAPYKQGNIFNHEPLRTRKLLLHKKEIIKLNQKIKEQGFTIVPTKIYLSKGRAKLEIALAKGKKLYDKRDSEKAKEQKREIDKRLKSY